MASLFGEEQRASIKCFFYALMLRMVQDRFETTLHPPYFPRFTLRCATRGT